MKDSELNSKNIGYTEGCRVIEMPTVKVASLTKPNGTTVEYYTLAQAIIDAQWDVNRGSTLKMLADYTINGGISVSNGMFTLDLNGHVLTEDDECITLLVYQNATMTIIDSSEGKTGLIYQDKARRYVSTPGIYIW